MLKFLLNESTIRLKMRFEVDEIYGKSELN